MKVPLLLVLLLRLPASGADRPDSLALRQAFRDCGQVGVVMNLSAHPDDEDGATLAYYRMQTGAATYSVLFTRGEGGQNEKGPELYQELGAIRSEETEAAGRILGTRVRFLNFLDFGYSKTATETFHFWGGQLEPLRRLVLEIRRIRPDILFTNHNTVDGHGHHQAVALSALAAFDAAADSGMFPEQLRLPGVSVWQVKKLYFRQFARVETPAEVMHPVEAIDSLRGISYVDVATEALRKHATQGMERANLRTFTRGRSQYRLMRASSLFERDSTSFFGGLDLWHDPDMEILRGTREEIGRLDPWLPPPRLLPVLSLLLGRIDSLGASGILRGTATRTASKWTESLTRIVELVAGVTFTGHLADTLLVSGQRVRVKLRLRAESAALTRGELSLAAPAGWEATREEEAPGGDLHGMGGEFTLRLGDSLLPTVPRPRMQYLDGNGSRDVTAHASCLLDGQRFHFQLPLRFDVAANEELTVSPEIIRGIPSRLNGGIRLVLRMRNRLPHPNAGRVELVGPPGWHMAPWSFAIKGEDDTTSGAVVVIPRPGTTPGDYPLRFTVRDARAEALVRIFDAKAAPGLRVGIIRSYDDALERALDELGVRYDLLEEQDLARGDLGAWHTILVDIRAYLVRADLRTHNTRLLEYVRDGGHLCVMYQRDQEWKEEYAPFPFALSRRRISHEEADVQILQPEHPFWRSPNNIVPEDWAGWVQERAVYLPSNVPPAYTRMLESHDPDEAGNDTGLLFAQVGRGSYCYTSYVWYRQLKELHAGAFRCFANMISYPLVRK